MIVVANKRCLPDDVIHVRVGDPDTVLVFQHIDVNGVAENLANKQSNKNNFNQAEHCHWKTETCKWLNKAWVSLFKKVQIRLPLFLSFCPDTWPAPRKWVTQHHSDKAVTRGWDRYKNKSQYGKLTLDEKILLLLQRFEPVTFQSRVWHSNHWALLAPHSRTETNTTTPNHFHHPYLLIIQNSFDEVFHGAVVEVVGEEMQHGGWAHVQLAVQKVLVQNEVCVVMEQLLKTQADGVIDWSLL